MAKSFEILGMQSILICSKDWDNSMRFWRDALGMEVAGDWSDDDHGAAALKFGESYIIVAGQEDVRDKEVGFPIEHGKIYLYVKVRGLDALIAHLKSQGMSIVSGPVQLHWGPKMVSVKDPEGVPVLFVEGEPDPVLVEKYSRETVIA